MPALYADVIQDGVPHVMKSSQKAGPYIFPEGHMLMSSLTEVLKGNHDWTEPDQFDPTRFIKDGKVRKLEALIPFSAGRKR